jgi:tetratricopeptide (TPR) repeat protein
VRLYAEERLAEAEESEALRARHRDHYLSVVSTISLEDAMWSAGATSFASDEIDNLRTALELSTVEGRFGDIGRMMLRADIWSWTGAHAEAKRWLDVALDHEADVEPEQRLELLAAVHVAALARIDREAFRPWARAQAWGTSGLADRCILIGLYVESAFNAVRNPEEALQIADEGLRLAETGLPSVWSGAMLTMRGQALTNLGDLTGAIAAYRKAEQGAELQGYPRWFATVEQTIPLHLLGEHGPALEAAVRAQGLEGRRVIPGFGEVLNGCMLALATAANGHPDRAEHVLAGLIERERRTNIPALFESWVGAYAWVAAINGEFERASRLLAASGSIYRTATGFALNRYYIRKVRDALDGDTARRCRAEGSAMSREDAIAEALRR